MSAMQLPHTIGGQWITGLTLVAFFISTTGCGITPGGDNGTPSADSYGVLVNTDTSKSLIGGVRMHSGGSVYVYGTFNDDGTVGEIQSAVLQNDSGQQATLFFESGRPVRAVGFDGATLDITYESVSSQRLTGQAVFTPVDGSAPVTIPFDIDLQKTAADLASTVQELTGLQISTESPPSSPAAKTTGGTALKPSHVRADSAVVQIVVVPILLAVTGFMVVAVIAQIMNVFARTLTAVARAATIAFLTPFIIMGEIMRLAVSQPTIIIEVSRDSAVLHIPAPPIR